MPQQSWTSCRRWIATVFLVMGVVSDIGDLKRLITGSVVGAVEASTDTKLLHYEVAEEIAPGTVVANIVNDAELHTYGVEVLRQLQFRFLSQSPGGLMSIDERTGILRTATRLDRDSMCPSTGSANVGIDERCQIRMDIVVQPMTHFRIVTVAVDVTDINDNSPRFEADFRSYDLVETSPPGVTAVSIPAATDPDAGVNGVQQYRLEYVDGITPAGKPGTTTKDFELKTSRKLDGSTELKLVLVNPLDRETRDTYHLRTVAIDGGQPPRSASIDIRIRVLDANDNSPMFERAMYETTIPESSAPMTTVARVRAVDRDLGVNAAITYYLSPATLANHGRTFAVDNATGDVYVVGTVDFETNPVYRLLISARDGGPEAVSADTVVVVRVTDVNDNPPKIVVNTLLASDTNVAEVPEDAGPGTFVGHVIVSDPDSGASGRFNCSLEDVTAGNDGRGSGGRSSGDDTGYFRLQKMLDTEFQIVTTGRSLDRELVDRYDVNVICTDGGRPSMTAIGQVTIHVTDVNDNWPTFVGGDTYRVDIVENNQPGALLTQISAVDRDAQANGRVAYLLADKSFERLFAVDADTGVIEARVRLDRELSPRYTFGVLAVDAGKPPRTASAVIEVNVIDVDDEPPRFDSTEYKLRVPENRSPGTVIATLSAHDDDLEPFNHFRFRLPALGLDGGGGDVSAFAINPTSGLLTTTRTLDRERKEVLRFVAVVEEINAETQVVVPDMYSNATIVVQVTDENDNAPVFINPKPSPVGLVDRSAPPVTSVGNDTTVVSAASTASSTIVQVWNRAISGHVITTVKAVDADSGDNSRIDYVIVAGNTDGLLKLDRKTGVLTTAQQLRGDIDDQIRHITIQATDHGVPKLTSTAYLTVVFNKSYPMVYTSTEKHDKQKMPAARLTNSMSMSIVIVAASCASGLALIFILIGVVCVVRCSRRRRYGGVGGAGRRRHSSTDTASSQKQTDQHQLPIDIMMDYPPMTTKLPMNGPDSDPELYDRCFPPPPPALTPSSSRRPFPIGCHANGRNGSCRYDDDFSATDCGGLSRPDVVRRMLGRENGGTNIGVEQRTPTDDVCSSDVRSSSTAEFDDRPLNGVCGTRLKPTKRRLSSQHPANEVVRFADLPNGSNHEVDNSSESYCIRTLPLGTNGGFRSRNCLSSSPGKAQGQGYGPEPSLSSTSPWQHQHNQHHHNHHHQQQQTPDNGGSKYETSCGGSKPNQLYTQVPLTQLRPQGLHTNNRPDATRCNSQYCVTSSHRLKPPPPPGQRPQCTTSQTAALLTSNNVSDQSHAFPACQSVPTPPSSCCRGLPHCTSSSMAPSLSSAAAAARRREDFNSLSVTTVGPTSSAWSPSHSPAETETSVGSEALSGGGSSAQTGSHVSIGTGSGSNATAIVRCNGIASAVPVTPSPVGDGGLGVSNQLTSTV